MSSFYVGPLDKFLIVNELDRDVVVNVISRFDFGEEEYDLCLKAKRVTECNFTVESDLDHHSLYICPQRRGSPSHAIMYRYDHECPNEVNLDDQDKIRVKFERMRCLAVPDVAFMALTEDANNSPASLSQLSLWACVLHGIDSQTILEYTHRFYDTRRIHYHRVIGADLERIWMEREEAEGADHDYWLL
jgi:hypothetical protein